MAQEAEPAASHAVPSVLHPRGRIAPPLPGDAPAYARVVRAIVRLGQGLYYHDALNAAPAMAFHVFLSLLPLLVFLGYVLGSIAKRNGVEAVLWPVLEHVPDASAAVLKKEVERLAGATTLGPLAAFGFLWLASGGTHGLMDALEAVVGAPRRPWWRKRLLAAGWVIVSLVVLSAASWGMVEWDAVIHRPVTVYAPAAPAASLATSTEAAPSSSAATPSPSSSAPRRPPHERLRRQAKILRGGGERAFALLLSLASIVVALACFYRFSVSHPRRVKRRVVPGAALAVALWLAISWAFGLYVRTLAGYAVFYGSLAAVAVLLVWLWLSCLAVLVGAEMNAQLEGLRD